MNDMGARGIAGAIKMLPAMGLGTAGMAAQSGLENYDRTENPISAAVASAQSATAMKLMGANKGMPMAKSVAWVSGVSGVDSFVSTLAQTGDVKAAMQEGVKAAVQMATMDIANRGMMPHPGAVYDSIYQEGTKAGLPEQVVDHLAQLSQQTYDYQSQANEFVVKRNQALLEKAGALAQDSKLNQRMTEKFEDLVKGIKDDYQVDDAYIPVEEFDRIFSQGGLDPEQVANTLMSDPSKYSEAKEAGTSVQIPLQELVTRFSGLPQYAELTKHTALGVGGSSAAEVDLFNAQRDTEIKQFVDKAEQTLKDEEPAQKVYQDISDKLIAAGRPPEVAHWEALLQSQRQRARAAARGAGEDGTAHDAWSVYQERPDEIVNAANEKYRQADGTFSQPSTDSPEFKKWFGESKVVDENGAPLVMYHGTTGDFEIFARIDGGNAYGPGYYFTGDPAEASGYADGSGGGRIRPSGSAAPNVMPVYLNAKNVFSLDNRVLTKAEIGQLEAAGNKLNPGAWKKGELAKAFDRVYRPTAKNVMQLITEQAGGSYAELAQSAGYDGLLGSYGLVVFSPEQIKSAIGNRGTFDPNDPNILHQPSGGDRGQIDVSKADKFTSSFLKDADLSTFVHESAHQFLEEMAADSQRDDVSQKLKDDFQSILKWMKVSSWDEVQRSHHEQWAKAFEDYLRTGKAPSLDLQPAFQRFKGWLLEVYRGIKSRYFEDSKLSPEISAVMDRMLASQDEIDQARHRSRRHQ
jgi:hypothetical protein